MTDKQLADEIRKTLDEMTAMSDEEFRKVMEDAMVTGTGRVIVTVDGVQHVPTPPPSEGA